MTKTEQDDKNGKYVKIPPEKAVFFDYICIFVVKNIGKVIY